MYIIQNKTLGHFNQPSWYTVSDFGFQNYTTILNNANIYSDKMLADEIANNWGGIVVDYKETCANCLVGQYVTIDGTCWSIRGKLKKTRGYWHINVDNADIFITIEQISNVHIVNKMIHLKGI